MWTLPKSGGVRGSQVAGNSLSNSCTYTSDYELDLSGVYDGATDVIERTHTRTDKLNLTNIWDNVNTSNNISFWANPANRLQNANGPWGQKTFYYDGVGNRTYENTTVSSTTTSDNLQYNGTSNRVQSVVRGGTTTVRAFTYDGAGNILTDTRSGVLYTYTYNKANRLKTVTSPSGLLGTYTYNGFEQLVARVITNSGAANGTVVTVHDLWGNVIAELNSSGQTVREYIWLPETEIAPTRQARAQVDRPIAVIDGVNTASPTTLYVHADHLNRPVRMTNSAKASVWDVIWNAWGTPYSITGAQTLNARFPGQWYQLEAGLHYNWHRHYDPTIGRYTQPDPLGFVDGPSVYAYAGNNPLRLVDKDGRSSLALPPSAVPLCFESPLNAAICALIIATPPVIAYCMASSAANDNRPPTVKTDCDKAYYLCLQARGLFTDKGACAAARKACKAGQTTIYAPGLVGSDE